MEELRRVALSDPRQLFGHDGRPLAVNELSDEAAAAVGGVEVMEEFEGRGEDRQFIGYTKKYRLWDKNQALVTLAKHLGLLQDLPPAAGAGVHFHFYMPENQRGGRIVGNGGAGPVLALPDNGDRRKG